MRRVSESLDDFRCGSHPSSNPNKTLGASRLLACIPESLDDFRYDSRRTTASYDCIVRATRTNSGFPEQSEAQTRRGRVGFVPDRTVLSDAPNSFRP